MLSATEKVTPRLGAHVREHDGVAGTAFAVWAPSARAVSVVGDFNGWDRRLHPMRSLGGAGVWERFIPGIEVGARYKYEIVTSRGEVTLKADPYARQADRYPGNASIVCQSRHVWSLEDRRWVRSRAEQRPLERPMSIYEVHLGSWRRRADHGKRPLTYLELADELGSYVHDMGFTHVELLPVMAHPFPGSWGYQVSNYFAPEPRHGDPDDLRQLIDRLHVAGIGVIMDWVPAHFSCDQHALGLFDGSALFEHPDPDRRAHPDWGTLQFNYGRREVCDFLIANALFWLHQYHADGLRVDAVASMLSHRDAVGFLRQLNEVISRASPGAVTVAEETSAWPGVSKPAHLGGLGFALKWNTGWMHDTLGYFARDEGDRRRFHHDLTFSMMYAFSENFVLPLSHDDVAAGRGSLLSRMAGRDRREQLANLRALYAYMWAHPGKKLLFMGNELAQEADWSDQRALDWDLLERPEHLAIQRLVRDLNLVYRDEAALWQLDGDWSGFRWLEPDDAEHSVFAFVRASREEERVLVFAANLGSTPQPAYRVGLPRACRWREALNTDAVTYGGTGHAANGRPMRARLEPDPIPWHGQPVSAELALPPRVAVWLVPDE